MTSKTMAQAIVEVFETGAYRKGGYGTIACIRGDTGGLSYGKHQSTLASGLGQMLRRYINAGGAQAQALMPFIARLEAHDMSLNKDQKLRAVLTAAGDDPIMAQVQDAYFDEAYWVPAVRTAANLGLRSGLGQAVVYDSFIQGGFKIVAPAIKEREERAWVVAYIAARRAWLANHRNPVLHTAVYRMDGFSDIISHDNWELEPPIKVRGIMIDPEGSSDTIPVTRASALEPSLSLTAPPMSGELVKRVQEKLNLNGANLVVDGVFGPQMERRVKFFQSTNRLVADGTVGPITLHKLGL